MIDTAEIERLKGLCERASEGPWASCSCQGCRAFWLYSVAACDALLAFPTLLDELEESRARVKLLEEAIGEIATKIEPHPIFDNEVRSTEGARFVFVAPTLAAIIREVRNVVFGHG